MPALYWGEYIPNHFYPLRLLFLLVGQLAHWEQMLFDRSLGTKMTAAGVLYIEEYTVETVEHNTPHTHAHTGAIMKRLFLVFLVFLAQVRDVVAGRSRLQSSPYYYVLNHACMQASAWAYAAQGPEWAETALQQGPGVAAVVAKDGSGDFTTISSALDAAPRNSTSRYVVRSSCQGSV